jgi:hypothetical protein
MKMGAMKPLTTNETPHTKSNSILFDSQLEMVPQTIPLHLQSQDYKEFVYGPRSKLGKRDRYDQMLQNKILTSGKQLFQEDSGDEEQGYSQRIMTRSQKVQFCNGVIKSRRPQ